MASEMAGGENARPSGSSTSRSPAGRARPPMIWSAKARRTRCSPISRPCGPASMPERTCIDALARLRAALGLSAAFGRGCRAFRRPLEPGRRADDLCGARTLDRLGGIQSGFCPASGADRAARIDRRDARRPDRCRRYAETRVRRRSIVANGATISIDGRGARNPSSAGAADRGGFRRGHLSVLHVARAAPASRSGGGMETARRDSR